MNRHDILMNIENPRELEKLYRDNKASFKSEFNLLYPELTNNKIADYWIARLNYEGSEISWGSKIELTLVIILSLIAGLIAKLPEALNINPDFFYQRNVGFIIFPMLTAYFIWKRNLSSKKIIVACIVFLISAIFVNFLPATLNSDTLVLTCIHLPLLLWAVLGFTFVGNNAGNYSSRLDFLKYNGDLAILSALIVISGGILTGITIGLFSVIGINIEKFYTENIVVLGAAAVPIIGTYITQTNPQLVSKISPIIARIFCPLVLITLLVYLVAIFVSGKDPYNDREFLMIFNLLLIGVMAIILFSVSATAKNSENRTNSIILFALSIVTIAVNSIAFSAIVFRISEYGITPNRLAVLGGNILILTNLLIVSYQLFRNILKKVDISEVENSISKFLPIYIVWTIVVTFIFPLIFNFK